MLALSMSMVRSCAPRENIPAGCSKRLFSKAAASEDPEAYPLGRTVRRIRSTTSVRAAE
jgi:hypothetical protein